MSAREDRRIVYMKGWRGDCAKCIGEEDCNEKIEVMSGAGGEGTLWRGWRGLNVPRV